MPQPNENTGRLYGCLGMERAISKSQLAFQEDQFSPRVTHKKTGTERTILGTARGSNEKLRVLVVLFLKISLPLL